MRRLDSSRARLIGNAVCHAAAAQLAIMLPMTTEAVV
jgi:hypothetical protein